jgi:hypothetical protein
LEKNKNKFFDKNILARKNDNPLKKKQVKNFLSERALKCLQNSVVKI